ncbi:MAG: aminotransferase class I/II-fold pyridoxal phosphate-dependent enzyme [Lachnospiraceae bacterium]|nr:aminotransferase class I/II-fold pyridoxal phosphate-dependent enzyme [Lachnospiraceae bacterium]
MEKTLLERLKEYSASDFYPLHMPGHKRQWGEGGTSGKGGGAGDGFPNPFSIDITEIDGFDNLHHAEGILRESMDRAAEIYGADESCYLVNGSSCGILSAICGCTARRGKILMSRNCHKSAYHGIYLNELDVEYIYPQIITELGIQGGILPEDVEKKLNENPDIQTVLIVSPTYDGMVSDVRRISEVVHRHGGVLLVDEAHGAHFPFGKEGEFPVSALDEGADVVIQSLHKTLPSLTQTAILHMRKKFLGTERMERIKRYLSIYQSSSPSYLFMASMESCIRYMDGEGREALSRLYERLEGFRDGCRELTGIQVPGKEWIGRYGVYDMDLSKILMFPGGLRRSGVWLGDWLREKHHLELEMSAPQYGLALTSLMDGEEGFRRLLNGLKELEQLDVLTGEAKDEMFYEKAVRSLCHPEAVCRIWEAMEADCEIRPLKECTGEISAEFVYLYPPGIPYLVPGERIADEMILFLSGCQRMGLSIQGMQDLNGFQLKIWKNKG